MAGTGFLSFVANLTPISWFVTTGIVPWQTALKCTAVRHNRNNPLAIRSQIQILAIHGMIIVFVTIHGTIILFVGNPQYDFFLVAIRGTHLSAVGHNRVKSRSSHLNIDSSSVRCAASF
jgi:hypothetical protein